MARVELQNIVKRWGNTIGVRDLSLDIADREFLVLLGPSGCGKTTTMRMIAGLEEPSQGTVRIGDRVMNGVEPKDRDIAMVFQSYGLYAHLSVYENIRFPLKVRKVPAELHHEKVMKAARMVELEPLLERKPKALSGGQRQRVALARAIVREPNCFLMDEPLSNLDARLRMTMRSEIRHLHSQLNVTTIYVTHDQVEAMTLADRVAVMEKGEIRQLGRPKDIYDRPASVFVAGFIGAPAMSLLKGDLVDGVFVAEDIRVQTVLAGSRPDVVLGVRAEDMSLATGNDAAFARPVYSVEMLGDSTLVTQRYGSTILAARMAKDFVAREGDIVGLKIAPSACHVFDNKTGNRIDMLN